MCECPVSFCHTVGIFFLLESSPFFFVGSHNFSSQLLSHAMSASLAGVKNHIFNRDGSFPARIDFCRYLESCTTNTAALYFHLGSNIFQRLLPDFQSRFLFFFCHFFVNDIQCVIKDLNATVFLPSTIRSLTNLVTNTSLNLGSGNRILFFGLVFLILFSFTNLFVKLPFIWSSTVSQPFTQLFFPGTLHKHNSC